MGIQKQTAIDKIAKRLKSLLEETGHLVEIKIGEDEAGYWLNFDVVKPVDGKIWVRYFSLTDTLPTSTRYPRFQRIYKYHPKMNHVAIFDEVRIDPPRSWPTDVIWDSTLYYRSIRPRD